MELMIMGRMSLHVYYRQGDGHRFEKCREKQEIEQTTEQRDLILEYILFFIEFLLPLTTVPIKCPRDAVNPILLLFVKRQHTGEGIPTCRYGDIVPWVQLDSGVLLAWFRAGQQLFGRYLPFFSVKAGPAAGPSIKWNTDA
jgi:hypothetical protein